VASGKASLNHSLIHTNSKYPRQTQSPHAISDPITQSTTHSLYHALRTTTPPHPFTPLPTMTLSPQHVARQITKRPPTASTADDYRTAEESSEDAGPTPSARKRTRPSKVYDDRCAIEEVVLELAGLDDEEPPVSRPAKRGRVSAPAHPQKRRRVSVPEPAQGGGRGGGGIPPRRGRRSAPGLVPSPIEEEEEEALRKRRESLLFYARSMVESPQAVREARWQRRRNRWVFAQVHARLRQLEDIERRRSQKLESRHQTIDSTTRSSSADVEVVRVEGFGERRSKAELEEDEDDYGVLKDRPWSEEETAAVVMGMEKFREPADRWLQIKLEHPEVLRRRTPADCLDKAIEIRRVVKDEMGMRLGSTWENF